MHSIVHFCIKLLGDIAEKYFRVKYEAMVKSSEQHAKHQAIGEREKEEWVKLLASFAKCSHAIADKTCWQNLINISRSCFEALVHSVLHLIHDTFF